MTAQEIIGLVMNFDKQQFFVSSETATVKIENAGGGSAKVFINLGIELQAFVMISEYYNCCGIGNISNLYSYKQGRKLGKALFYASMFYHAINKKALVTASMNVSDAKSSVRTSQIIRDVHIYGKNCVTINGPIKNPNSGNMIEHYTINVRHFFKDIINYVKFEGQAKFQEEALKSHFLKFIAFHSK